MVFSYIVSVLPGPNNLCDLAFIWFSELKFRVALSYTKLSFNGAEMNWHLTLDMLH